MHHTLPAAEVYCVTSVCLDDPHCQTHPSVVHNIELSSSEGICHTPLRPLNHVATPLEGGVLYGVGVADAQRGAPVGGQLAEAWG